jgi:hypothetical protein
MGRYLVFLRFRTIKMIKRFGHGLKQLIGSQIILATQVILII